MHSFTFIDPDYYQVSSEATLSYDNQFSGSYVIRYGSRGLSINKYLEDYIMRINNPELEYILSTYYPELLL